VFSRIRRRVHDSLLLLRSVSGWRLAVPLLGQASLPTSKIDTAYQYHRIVSKTLPQGARYTFGGYHYTFGGYQNWSNLATLHFSYQISA